MTRALPFRFVTLTTCSFIFLRALPGAAQGVQPLRAELSYCQAGSDVSLEEGYQGPGWGTQREDRYLSVFPALFTESPNDDVAAALDLVETIELCWVMAGISGPLLSCPGLDWLIFDQTTKNEMPAGIVRGRNSATPSKKKPPRVDLRGIDWDLPGHNDVVIVLRVTERGQAPITDPLVLAQQFGACQNWITDTPSGARFRMVSVDRALEPFGMSLDVCAEGSLIQWAGSGPHTDPVEQNACIEQPQAEYMLETFERLHLAQMGRLQGLLALNQRQQAWINGVDDAGTPQPLRVVLGPHLGGGGQAPDGRIHLNVYRRTAAIDPSKPLVDARPHLALPAHEFFHTLSKTWARERGTEAITTGFGEQLAVSQSHHLCLFDFPGAPSAEECVFAARWEEGDNGVIGTELLASPETGLLTTEYRAGLFWRYVYEQFSYPALISDPHPGETASGLPRDLSMERRPLADRQLSDDGFDFVGLMYDEFARTPDGVGMYGAMNTALKTHLGRHFDDVLRAYHTALYVKDYSEPRERHRFDWNHLDGFRATTAIEDGKPFDVPCDLTGSTCNGARTICDGMPRAKREYDSFEARSCAAYPDALRRVLPVGTGVASTTPVALDEVSATAVSVSLEQPFWGQAGNIGVRVRQRSGDPAEFQVFQVLRDATTGALEVQYQCPAPTCVATPVAGNSAEKELNLSLPILETTEEILVVASNQGTDAHFDWSIGPIAPRVQILEPTSQQPAFVGHALTNRRSFLAKIALRDDRNFPISLRQEDLTVSVPDCALAGTTGCVLEGRVRPDGTENPDFDYTVLGLSGGYALLMITLPEAFYPSPTPTEGTFDLEVEVAGIGGVRRYGALAFDDDLQTQSTVLVLDTSGSMAGEKLDALKVVGKALVASMMPPAGETPLNSAGIVAFKGNATTPLGITLVQSLTAFEAAIDGLTASGQTSIGDAVFEAQSNLAAAYDLLPPADQPTRQAMVILSDGKNTAEHLPNLYWGSEPSPTNDEDGAEWENLISWDERDDNSLPLPVISSVSIGQDVALYPLARLARLSDGTSLVLPLDETAPSPALPFAEAMTAAYSDAADYDRVFTVTGGTGELLPIPVSPGTSELRLAAVSDTPNGLFAPRLYPPGPGGVVHACSGDSTAVTAGCQVRNPEPGVWTFQAATETVGSYFAEVSVRGSTQLFTSVDAPSVAPIDELKLDGDPTPRVGTPIELRASLIDGKPFTDCSITVRITPPTGSARTLTLKDNGRRADGPEGDGVFAVAFTRTGEPGLYDAKFSVNCVLPGGAGEVVREKRRGFTMRPLEPAEDSDADGMPDTWEQTYDLDPLESADAASDQDGDDLAALDEFLAGTSPLTSDSDRGGESDASELILGTDPAFDPDDDRVTAPILLPVAGNGFVYLPAGMRRDGKRLVVERGPTLDGPFERVDGADVPGESYAIDPFAENGVTVCYRLRTEAEASMVVSGWSAVRCVVPGEDPHPPRIDLSVTPGNCASLRLSLELFVDDLDEVPPSRQPDLDLGVEPTPAREMRVWFAAGEPPAGTTWEPLMTAFDVVLPNENVSIVSVQVRDEAGNESLVESVVVPRCTDSACDVPPVVTHTLPGCEPGAKPIEIFEPEGCDGFLVSSNGNVLTPPMPVTGGTLTLAPGSYGLRWDARDSGSPPVSETQTLEVVVGDAATCCQGKNKTLITGTAAADNIVPSLVKPYCVLAAGGADYVLTKSASDILIGGDGADYLNAGSGADVVDGQAGGDSIYGGTGSFEAHGGEGDDALYGNSASSARLFGGRGNDNLVGSPGADVIEPGHGRDTVAAGGGADRVVVHDLCQAVSGKVLDGGTGQDTLVSAVSAVSVAALRARGVTVRSFETVVIDTSLRHLADCP